MASFRRRSRRFSPGVPLRVGRRRPRRRELAEAGEALSRTPSRLALLGCPWFAADRALSDGPGCIDRCRSSGSSWACAACAGPIRRSPRPTCGDSRFVRGGPNAGGSRSTFVVVVVARTCRRRRRRAHESGQRDGRRQSAVVVGAIGRARIGVGRPSSASVGYGWHSMCRRARCTHRAHCQRATMTSCTADFGGWQRVRAARSASISTGRRTDVILPWTTSDRPSRLRTWSEQVGSPRTDGPVVSKPQIRKAVCVFGPAQSIAPALAVVAEPTPDQIEPGDLY